MTGRSWVAPCLAAAVALGCVGTSEGAGAQWQTRASTPTERSEVAAASIGRRIVVSGGLRSNGVAVSTVEIYDARSDVWTTGRPLPQAAHHPMSVGAGGRVFFLGGYPAWGEISDRAFMFQGGQWTELPAMPEPRGAGGAAFAAGKIYVVGGVGPAGQATTTMVFDPVSSTWSTAPGLPTPREHLGVASYQGKVYVAGGRTGGISTNLDAFEVFDPATGSWEVLPDMPTARGGLAAAATGNGFIVAVGGEQPGSTFEEAEAFDVAGGVWISLPPLPTPRHGLGVVAIGNVVFAVTGGTVPGLSVSDVNEAIAVPAD